MQKTELPGLELTQMAIIYWKTIFTGALKINC